jgi:hypothetical protein
MERRGGATIFEEGVEPVDWKQIALTCKSERPDTIYWSNAGLR